MLEKGSGWSEIASGSYQKREKVGKRCRLVGKGSGSYQNSESDDGGEDTILLALQSPEVYDDIARGTRRKFETNRPRAVLFEGPPGTGKTSCARVIANQAGVPLLYVPLEIIMSKYYGESERVDSFATARDGETHEATRRLLSVLLRQIDGFEQEKKVVVVAATNRKQDLDPALISRFDSMITSHYLINRLQIAEQYAKHLTDSELSEFARATEGLSGRDMRDVCRCRNDIGSFVVKLLKKKVVVAPSLSKITLTVLGIGKELCFDIDFRTEA
ncbi:hypothetical protein HAX54_031262 [Datura stramonium]|uniref:AAA+ ATPase domain-containing protein n=1 Tax=Datura stramonium TaxID=4076 RepID=A0ABS8VBS6_DATST|nr:hypothetical protein [Datura stramonium]